MADEGFKRKLTAILSADVIGYSRLMRDNEEATVRDIAAHRVLISEIIQQHHGRVVDSPGDNILAEFASVVDAVNGAIKIQQEIKKRNADTHEDRRMEFRIGVNLGDVIEEEERIYGDGVNIAARVEGLAAGGGIAISGTVYEHIKEKLSLGYYYLGEQEVKNISEPVRVYRLLTEPADAGKMIDEKKPKSKKLRWAVFGAVALIVLVVGALAIWNSYFRPSFEPASVEKMAFPLPEKPSIAVLAFDNLSGDPEQEYFNDGLSEEIITALSKSTQIFVIARNSSFTYKGKPVKVQQVAEELGVRYVLEGSVRKAGDKVRINAQLIDATTGGHLWAERYDGQMEDIFSLQDQITQKIVAALAVKLTPTESENIASKGTDNIEAYDAFLRGWQHYLQGTPESFAQAIANFSKAVDIDPDFSKAYAALALVHLNAGSSKEWYEALGIDYFTLRVKARHLLNIAMKNPTSLAFRVASKMELKRRNHEKALQNAEKAIALNPADPEGQFAMAEVLVYSGRPKEAIKIANTVMRLDPNKMADCLKLIGKAHFCLGEYEEAIVAFNRSLKFNPASWVYEWIASTHANLGNDKDARAAFEIEKKRLLEVSAKGETAKNIKLDLQSTVYTQPFNNPEVTQRFVGGLIEAGWPEPHRYYEVYKENKLTGDEVRDLVLGRTQVLSAFAGGGWTQKFGKDGSVTYKGFGMQDTGKHWIEGDQSCIAYNRILARLPVCIDLYRNPGGTFEKKDEYLMIHDFNMLPVSYVD